MYPQLTTRIQISPLPLVVVVYGNELYHLLLFTIIDDQWYY